MSSTPEIALIDAMIADIKAESDLSFKSVFPYRRPIALLPTDCPALVVWLIEEELQAMTTQRFDYGVAIGLSYHEASVRQAKTLLADSKLQKSLLEAVHRLKMRVHSWGTNGLTGEPGEAWQITPAGSATLGPSEEDGGLTEGVVFQVNTRITQD